MTGRKQKGMALAVVKTDALATNWVQWLYISVHGASVSQNLCFTYSNFCSKSQKNDFRLLSFKICSRYIVGIGKKGEKERERETQQNIMALFVHGTFLKGYLLWLWVIALQPRKLKMSSSSNSFYIIAIMIQSIVVWVNSLLERYCKRNVYKKGNTILPERENTVQIKETILLID